MYEKYSSYENPFGSKRRVLARNKKYNDPSFMTLSQVMESFNTFVKAYKKEKLPLEKQVEQFCKKYSRVKDYKDVILKAAIKQQQKQEN